MRKTQYLVIDSDFVQGTNNNFVVSFGITSNTFIQEMKDVIAIKLVDIYITQIGANDGGTGNAAKYIDIICNDIPYAGQMLSERTGQVFARVPLERDSDGGQSYLVHDKEWKPYSHDTRYFNPISISKLAFQVYEYQGDGDYVPLQPDAEFYMVLEITTIDHKAPPDDKLVTVIESLDTIVDKLDAMTKLMITARKEVKAAKKKWPVKYLVAGIVAIGLVIYLLMRSFRTSSQGLSAVPGQGAGQVLGQRPGLGPGAVAVPGQGLGLGSGQLGRPQAFGPRPLYP